MTLDDCPSETASDFKHWIDEGSIEMWGDVVHLSTQEHITGVTTIYFQCPRCGRRCRKLFLVDHLLKCQKCSGLLYASQLERPEDRNLRRVLKLSAQLGMKSALDELIVRPKHMRTDKFYRLLRELRKAWREKARCYR